MSNCPPLTSKLCMPKVLWYQTDARVILRIMLPGVESYYLGIDEDHLRFSTTIGGRDYYMCLYQFGAVITDKCRHLNKGREVVVHLPKAHRGVDWPRLSMDKKTNPQIIPDPDRIQDPEFEDQERCISSNEISATRMSYIKQYRALHQKYMQQNNISKMLVPDDSPSSGSDDEMMDALFD